MTESLPQGLLDIVATLPPIALDELQDRAALRTRVDRKYVVDWHTLERVVGSLRRTHRALEIDGQRTFEYDTVYFDSPGLWSYRAHLQQRRRRYKARTRHYVDSGLYLFEVKLKGRRGETIKHQMKCRPEDHGRLTEDARAFLAERLSAAYPRMELPDLQPTVRTRYHRVTLSRGAERVTCDFDLHFADGETEVLGLTPGYAIVESKCEGGLGELDRQLRRLGVSPIACSKYCVGVGLLREDVKVNELRWLLNRYFERPRSVPPRRLAHG
jgi:hypothetical protein